MSPLDATATALWREAEAALRSNPDRAQALCEQLLARAPGFWGAHWMLSRIHQSRRHFRKAVAHARESARCLASTSTPHELLMVSSGLISTGEYEASMRLLAQLAPGAGFTPPQLLGVIAQHMMLDDPAAALPWLDFARDAGMAHQALSLHRGNALKFLGQFDAAESAFEEAIRLAPRDPNAHLALASLAIAAGRDARIARLEKAIAQEAANSRSMPVFLYALFKELDHAGDPDRAWPALESAMARKAAERRYDAATDDAIFDRLIAASKSLPVADAAGAGERVPLFIIGLPRSGTTLVERILGNHADVINCGELSELRMACKWASDDFSEGFLDLRAAERVAATDPRIAGERYLAATRWRVGERRWHTDKHPGNLVLAGVALAGMPNAKLVHVRKQPMDGCFGCLRELFVPGYYDYSYAFADMANHYRNYARWMRHLREVAPTRILDVQYEDLVADPVAEAERLVSFCGLPAQPGVHDITANRQQVTTASSVQVRTPIHAGRVGIWRRYQRQLQPLEDALGDLSA